MPEMKTVFLEMDRDSASYFKGSLTIDTTSIPFVYSTGDSVNLVPDTECPDTLCPYKIALNTTGAPVSSEYRYWTDDDTSNSDKN